MRNELVAGAHVPKHIGQDAQPRKKLSCEGFNPGPHGSRPREIVWSECSVTMLHKVMNELKVIGSQSGQRHGEETSMRTLSILRAAGICRRGSKPSRSISNQPNGLLPGLPRLRRVHPSTLFARPFVIRVLARRSTTGVPDLG